MSEHLLNRLKNIFGTGIVTRVETGIVQLRLATGIINDRIKRPHNYGFMSRPLPGAKGYTLFVGGDTSRGITVCIEDERYQMELEPGDVAMLDDKGNLIHFHKGGIKVISQQTVELTAKKTVFNSVFEVNGETTINGLTTINAAANITGVCAVGGLAAVGGGAVPAKGGMTMTGGDVTVDGVSSTKHKHRETNSVTSPPIK